MCPPLMPLQSQMFFLLFANCLVFSTILAYHTNPVRYVKGYNWRVTDGW